MMGILQAIYIAERARQPLVAVEEVRAVVGQGLEGDRYFLGRGSMSRWPGAGRAVSLIAEEVIEAVLAGSGLDLSNGRSRRNLITRGVDLSELIGRTFRIGAVVFKGARECAPCGYLERRIGPGLVEALRGRGGLRADVVVAGMLCRGDDIEVLGEGSQRR